MSRKAIGVATILGLVLGGLLIGAQWWSLRDRDASGAGGVAYYQGLPHAGAVLGDPDAPVLVEEFLDYQCPHCHTSVDRIARPLVDRYVKTGQVRFAYRMFPILGPESILAAEAAACAAQQDEFWPYQAVLLQKRGMGNRGTYTLDRLVEYAKEAGVDAESLGACLNDDTVSPLLAEDYERANELGLRGTPTFIVNGSIVSISTLEAVEEAIGDALEKEARKD